MHSLSPSFSPSVPPTLHAGQFLFHWHKLPVCFAQALVSDNSDKQKYVFCSPPVIYSFCSEMDTIKVPTCRPIRWHIYIPQVTFQWELQTFLCAAAATWLCLHWVISISVVTLHDFEHVLWFYTSFAETQFKEGQILFCLGCKALPSQSLLRDPLGLLSADCLTCAGPRSPTAVATELQTGFLESKREEKNAFFCFRTKKGQRFPR